MTELKTLKNIFEEKCKEQGLDKSDWYESDIFSLPELKAEALNWIKWLENTEPTKNGYTEQEAIIKWINAFFNFTEEDLKILRSVSV